MWFVGWVKGAKINVFHLTDFLFGIFDVVQLHHPGENGTLAINTRVDCHFIHLDIRHRESPAGTCQQNWLIFPSLDHITCKTMCNLRPWCPDSDVGAGEAETEDQRVAGGILEHH